MNGLVVLVEAAVVVVGLAAQALDSGGDLRVGVAARLQVGIE